VCVGEGECCPHEDILKDDDDNDDGEMCPGVNVLTCLCGCDIFNVARVSNTMTVLTVRTALLTGAKGRGDCYFSWLALCVK